MDDVERGAPCRVKRACGMVEEAFIFDRRGKAMRADLPVRVDHLILEVDSKSADFTGNSVQDIVDCLHKWSGRFGR